MSWTTEFVGLWFYINLIAGLGRYDVAKKVFKSTKGILKYSICQTGTDRFVGDEVKLTLTSVVKCFRTYQF